jgi:hypothetical protein
MVIEKLTVTTTPTSILDLIITARGSYEGNTYSTAVQIKSSSAGVAVLAEDLDTANPISILDPNDLLTYESHVSFNLAEMLLSVAAGTQEVDLIASFRK